MRPEIASARSLEPSDRESLRQSGPRLDIEALTFAEPHGRGVAPARERIDQPRVLSRSEVHAGCARILSSLMTFFEEHMIHPRLLEELHFLGGEDRSFSRLDPDEFEALVIEMLPDLKSALLEMRGVEPKQSKDLFEEICQAVDPLLAPYRFRF